VKTRILEGHNLLKICPACGKELEIHPVSGWKACFLHGDFIISEDNLSIKWILGLITN